MFMLEFNNNVMKKFFLALMLFFSSIFSAFSDYKNPYENIDINREITYEEAYFYLFEDIETPKSYKYIDLKYTNIYKWSRIYNVLQKAVYMDLFANISWKIPLENKISYPHFAKLFDKVHIWLSISSASPSTWNVRVWDLIHLTESIENIDVQWPNATYPSKFIDFYNTIISEYYYLDDKVIDKSINLAIEWFLTWLWDKYSKFYSVKAKDNLDSSLSWEKYYWIWAYITKKDDWFYFVDTIKNSPADWKIISWDKILIIQNKIISMDYTIWEISDSIKWEKGSEVKITVLRNSRSVDLKIIRGEVKVSHIDYEIVNNETLFIKSSVFDDAFSWILKDAFSDFSKVKWKNIIFDFRWNSWWIVEEASDSLSYFIPEWELLFYIDYGSWDTKKYYSQNDFHFDLSNYNVSILTDKSTASASEIFILSLRHYFPEIKIFWETTYGKWTVQKVIEYDDSTAIKYTAWKWFSPSWESIDKTWIKPEFSLEKITEKNIINYVLNTK